MMKALKAGLFGLALGAVAVPTQEAEAQVRTPTGCAHQEPPSDRSLICAMPYAECKANANGSVVALIACEIQRGQCLSN